MDFDISPALLAGWLGGPRWSKSIIQTKTQRAGCGCMFLRWNLAIVLSVLIAGNRVVILLKY